MTFQQNSRGNDAKPLNCAPMTIWRIIAHHTDRATATDWMRKHRRIAIGWGKIGDLAQYHSVDEIKAAIKENYPAPDYPQNSGNGGPSLWDFANTIKIGDLVIVSGDKGRELVVEIVGEYEFIAGESPLFGGYFNQRAVELTQYDGDKLWRAAGGAMPGVSVYRTLVRCQNAVNVNEL